MGPRKLFWFKRKEQENRKLRNESFHDGREVYSDIESAKRPETLTCSLHHTYPLNVVPVCAMKA
jgi:hypothetical protein